MKKKLVKYHEPQNKLLFRQFHSRNLGFNITICFSVGLILLFLSTSVFAQSQIPTLTKYATDQTGTLAGAEIEQLNRALSTFEDSTSNQIVFLMISSLEGYSLDMFAYETSAKNNIGSKKNNNGVFFLVSKEDRKMRIEVGYGLEGVLPDALASSIIRNEVTPYFKKGDYKNGVRAGLSAIILATRGEYTGTRRRNNKEDGGGLGSLVTFIIFIVIYLFSRLGGRGRGGRGGGIFYVGGFGGSSGGGFSSGGGGGGFGGFSGGGGGFGGGGASGGW